MKTRRFIPSGIFALFLTLCPLSLYAESVEEQINALKERIEELEESRQTEFETKGIWDDIYIGGELEIEYVDTQSDKFVNPFDGESTQEPHPHFQIDQLYLYPRIIKENVMISADILITGDEAKIEEAWVRFTDISWLPSVWVELGLNDPFISDYARKTETEVLVETAFYLDDELGIHLGGDFPHDFYWRASLTNGFRLGSQEVSEDDAYPMLHDDRSLKNSGSYFMGGFGAGWRRYFENDISVNIMPFYYQGKISEADEEFLLDNDLTDGLADNGSIKRRYGFNAEFGWNILKIVSQYMRAADGPLHREAYFLQPSIKLDDILKKLEMVVRFSRVDIDYPSTGNSLTWDRQQRVLGFIYPIFNKAKLKVEYISNGEDFRSVSDGSVDNNEVLVQFEYRW